MNVAVGGTNGFIPEDGINRGGDPQYVKPWANGLGQSEAIHNFWDARANWYSIHVYFLNLRRQYFV